MRSRAGCFRPVARLAILLSCLPVLAAGATTEDAFSEAWRWVHFTTDSGLPSSAVTFVADLPGAGLWVITRAGIARYDGFRWQKVDLPAGVTFLPATLVPSGLGGVAAVAGGELISGSAAGLRRVTFSVDGHDVVLAQCARARSGPLLLRSVDGVLYEWDGQSARRHAAASGLGAVLELRQAGPAAAWISTGSGVYSFDGGLWRRRLPPAAAPFALGAVFERSDESAIAYIVRPIGLTGLWEWGPGGAPRRVAEFLSSPIETIAECPGGVAVASHSTGEVSLHRANAWRPLEGAAERLVDVRSVGYLLSGPDLCVATDHGLFLHRRSASRWKYLSFPSPDEANAINEIVRSRDGTMWFATGRGLIRMGTDGAVTRIEQAGRERLAGLTGLAEDTAGRLWLSAGAILRGVRWHDSRGWHRLTQDAALDSSYVHKIVVDRSGNVWFLGLTADADTSSPESMTGPGTFRLSPNGVITRFGLTEGLPSGRVYALAEGADGSLWFGTSGGLSRWRDGRWRHYTTANGLRANRCYAVAADPSGGVWVGHGGAGLARVEGERIRYVTAPDSLANEYVWHVCVDAANRVWVATDGGVSVLEGDTWTTFDGRTGLRSARAWPILPVGNRVYIGTRGGGAAILDLDADRAPAPRVAALPPVVEGRNALLRWRANAWWSEVDPRLIPTRLRVDGGAWTSWSLDRDARLPALSPGRHVVTIQAKGPLGAIGAPGTTVVLTVEPPMWQQRSFFLPLTGLGIFALTLVGLLFSRQRRHHRELVEREQRFTKVFQSSPLAASMTDLESGRFLDVNAALVRLSGYSREELVGRASEEMNLVPGLDRPAIVAALEADGSVHDLEMTARNKAGDRLDVVVYLEVIELARRRAILMQMADVTERRRLEAQLLQAQKLESVGRLAGGVAHDFNNLLTVILGHASLLSAGLAPGDPHSEDVEQIRTAGERAERLTHQLLSFARKQVVEPRVVDVNDVVRRLGHMLRRLIGEDVELVTSLGQDVAPVLADPGQLEQVLVNLAVNARDAMPEGGTLTIRTSNILIDPARTRTDPDVTPGAYVRVSVTDTGHGMDQATAEKAFEPFFTTKEVGKGTGLGLATCYGIVKQAGGQIHVETREGEGSTFHVDLPRTSREDRPADSGAATARTSDGRETILLVEDEVQVRRIAVIALRQRGYHVLEAAGGPDALRLTDSHQGPIDMLITDVVMPQMRGTELARRLRELRPQLKVLLVSGYADRDVFEQEVGSDRPALLTKPFTPSTLAKRVRELLDEPGK